MVNNSTNINTPNNYLTTLIIEHEMTMTFDESNPVPRQRHVQTTVELNLFVASQPPLLIIRYGRVEPASGITTPSLDN